MDENQEQKLELFEQLNAHTSRFLDSLKVSRGDLEKQGLGLQSINAATTLRKDDRHDLALRYYRLAQWKEHILGLTWVSVRYVAAES